MPNRNFEIDMRMKADFSSADRAIDRTDGNLQRITKTTAAANRELASLNTSPSTGSAGGGAQAEAAGTEALNAALSKNAQARQAISIASAATQRAVAAEIGLIGDLQARLARGAGSFDELADTETRLDVAMRKGLISAEEYDQALGQLNIEQERLDREAQKAGRTLEQTVGRYDKAGAGLQRLARDEQLLKEAVDKGRISREQYNAAVATIGTERTRLEALRNGANNAANAMRGLNLQSLSAQQNIAQLVRYAASGQWQAAGTQLLGLGSRAGAVGVLFTSAGVAIAGVTAIVAGVAAAAVTGYLQMRALETALIATGHASGLTAGELAGVRDSIGSATGEFGKAQSALVQLANSGAFAGDTLTQAAQAAVNLSDLTGRSIEETTSDIIRLAKAPTAGLVELNQRYHFLTVATYDQVQSLEAQGRAQDAVKVGMDELARVSAQRAQEMQASAGLIERKWYDVRAAILLAVQGVKDLGRQDAEYRLQQAERKLSNVRDHRDLGLDAEMGLSAADREAQIAAATKEWELARKEVDLKKQGAKVESDAELAKQDTIDTKARLQKDFEAHLDRVSQRTKELKQLNEDILKLASRGETKIGDLTLGDYKAKRAAEIESQFKDPKVPKGPKAPKSDEQRSEEAAKRELHNLELQLSMLGDLAEGETKAGEAARIRYEIEDGAFKNASAATKAKLVDNAQALDEERRNQDIAKQLKSVDLEILKLQGKDAEATLQEVLNKYAELQVKLHREGDDVGAGKYQQLIDLTKTDASLETLQARYDVIQSHISQAQAQIDAKHGAGLLSDIDAQSQLVDLYHQQAGAVADLVPQMEALVATMGDTPAAEAWRAKLAEIRLEAERLQESTSLLKQKLGEVFESSLSSALEGLADRTKNLGDAVRGFFLDMAKGAAQFATQQIAQMARSKLFSILGKGKTPDLQSPDPTQAGAAGVAYAAPISAAAVALGGSAVPLTTAAAAITTAATALGVAAAAAGVSGGGGSSSTGTAANLFGALLSSYAGGYADGGHVQGPGTSTSDSIVAHLSNDEFVTRAAVVRQPGALALLSALNTHGMQALQDWTHRFDHARPLPTMPSAPRFHFADGGLARAAHGAVQNNFRFLNLLDVNELAAHLYALPSFEKAVVNRMMDNGNKLRGGGGG